MPVVGEPDGSNPEGSHVWSGDEWVPARVSLPNWRTGGSISLVWDNQAEGRCMECEEPVRRGEPVYRGPTRPWRSSRDPLIHVNCWR